MPWLDELEIVSTTPSMSFDGEEALDVKPDTKTFVIEFNRTVVNTDSVSAMLIRSGFPVEDQELTVSYSGNEVTRSEEHTSELQSLSAISYAVSLIGRAHV